MLEHFQRQDPSLMEKIRGCIVDSAPVANPDPQVKALAILRLGEHSHLFFIFCPMLFILFSVFMTLMLAYYWKLCLHCGLPPSRLVVAFWLPSL